MSTAKKIQILRMITDGVVAATVIDELFSGGVPRYESELWDYKLLIEDEATSFGEICRDVIAFYNSYGGFLIIGVADDYSLKGFSTDAFDDKRIKQKVRSYCGHDVVVRVDVVAYGGVDLLCISIPKRDVNAGVAVMIADGPQKNNKPTFRRGNVYFRSDESCQLIRDSDDMQFLSSARRHLLEMAVSNGRVVSHNLPDRAMICEHFLGRSDVKENLWVWLSDRMSRYRVLAGPGGFGKTSAAYSFAEDVVDAAPLGFWQVIWLSAKTRQFISAENRFVPLAYSGTSFDSFWDFESLLDSIAKHLPIQPDEMLGLGESGLIQLLQACLREIPSLFVIDDLDSLVPDDQRRVIELAMLIGGEHARFLLTTRKNYLAPAASTTQLPGLEGSEFREYVKVLEARYGRTLSEKDIAKLAAETQGSPLFTESVFRLMKLGATFKDALDRWKGEDGEAVRAAAFRKELEQLSLKAKRVLFAVSQFESVSAAEIRKVAELEAPQIEEAIHELAQLFLVTSEQIGDEPRFSSAQNINRLLFEHREEFVPGNVEIARRANLHRQASGIKGKSRGNDRFVARAISQAMAQLGDDPKGALVTIKSAILADKSNADLWMVYARCLSAVSPVNTDDVRNAFSKSYDLGKRERVLFEKWIKFETYFGNSNAAIDVAERAKAVLIPAPWEWLVNVAAAYHKRGNERLARLEFEDSASDFRIANERLATALRLAPEAAKSSVRAVIKRTTESLQASKGTPMPRRRKAAEKGSENVSV